MPEKFFPHAYTSQSDPLMYSSKSACQPQGYHANLLCIIPVSVCVAPKKKPSLILAPVLLITTGNHVSTQVSKISPVNISRGKWSGSLTKNTIKKKPNNWRSTVVYVPQGLDIHLQQAWQSKDSRAEAIPLISVFEPLTCTSSSALRLLHAIFEPLDDDLGYAPLNNTQMIPINTVFLAENLQESIQEIKMMQLELEYASTLHFREFKEITYRTTLIGSKFKKWARQ